MSDEAVYYIMDVRDVVGNCASWWRPQGKGYTCVLDDAGLYTLKYAEGCRETDVPVHKDIAEKLALRHVRVDHLRQHMDVPRSEYRSRKGGGA